MNCAVHPETAATAFCRTCGKAMCATCAHSVKGVIYCEECLATRLHDTVPAGAATAAPVVVRSGPNPGLAAFLGLIPFGIGAFYNGQFLKGIVHAFIFIGLVYGASEASGGGEVVFGLLIPMWIFYMAFDAYRTAKAMQTGEAVPDPLGLNKVLGTGEQVSFTRVPVGALILIILGLLFLANTMGWFHFWWVGRLWPLVLIGLGVWLFVKRFSRPATPGDSHAPTEQQ